MSVCLFVRQNGTRLPLEEFSWNLILEYFSKICRENSSFVIEETKGYFTWRLTYISIISRSFLLRMRNVSDKKCRENHNTYLCIQKLVFRKSCPLWGNVEKYCRMGPVTDQYGACALHGRLTLQIHTIKLSNTHCFSTAIMVAWTRLSVTLYVNCCLVLN